MSNDPGVFVERFAAFWRAPQPARVGDLLTDDVVLRQPVVPEARGLRAAEAEFRRMLRLVPDLRGEVLSWGHHEGALFIELELRGTFTGRELSLRVVDRFVLVGDRACSRTTYADPTPLFAVVARRPWSLFTLLSAKRRSRGSSSAGSR